MIISLCVCDDEEDNEEEGCCMEVAIEGVVVKLLCFYTWTHSSKMNIKISH